MSSIQQSIEFNLFNAGEKLMSLGTIKAIEMRAALCTTFHAVGRGGEAGLLTWKSLYWDFNDDTLCGTWAQQKVHNALDINFFADAQEYSICVVNALACYLIVGAGARFLTPHNIDKGWVFPNLAAGTATTMISNFLKECSTSIDELHSDVTATDLRVGSLCEIVYAEGGGLEVAIARGGWKGKGESLSALFEYWMNTSFAISTAGRILAGHLNPRVKCYPPRLSVILSDENEVCTILTVISIIDFICLPNITRSFR